MTYVPGDGLACRAAGASTGYPQVLPVRRGAHSSRIALLALLLALLSTPLPTRSEDAAQGAPASNEAAAKPNPFVDTVCPLMQEEADAMDLPAMLFVRLIWKESRFNPKAVSPKGAQGIAQFMPGTAADRGLDDPFEPKSAIVHSASLLADLKSEFGNIGLAAAAYNAGAERVHAWLDGRSSLPAETIGYVYFVTGRDAEEWKLPETTLPESLQSPAEDVVTSCRKLAPLVVRAVYETEPLTASGAWRPWGIQLSTSFSKARALSMFARLRQRYASVLSDRDPFVRPERNLSRGRRSLYMVQIGTDSRDDAGKLCAELRSHGGACIVQKN
ncbi:MAG TPA: transglycosylase SLT domain-containing protein [Methyloceanibacter sp.]|nr:transglycosylase SLT domain-containing protein [Methyloceanibacter sp.]